MLLNFRRLLLVSVFATVACRDSALDLTGVVTDSVVITVTAPGPCRGGAACDPAGAPFTTLALITVRNRGTADAYLLPCGSSAELQEQQMVNGQWQYIVDPASLLCAQGPASITLAAGDSIQTNSWLEAGVWRFVLEVAPAADLSGEALSASNGVNVR